MENRAKTLINMLYASIVVFIILVLTIVLEPIRDFVRDVISFKFLLFGFGGAFTVLGLAIVYLTKKWKIANPLKKYLLITGSAAAFFLIGSILHNMFYAIAIVFESTTIIRILAQALGVTTFLLSVLGSPMLFVIGTIGSIREYSKIIKKITA